MIMIAINYDLLDSFDLKVWSTISLKKKGSSHNLKKNIYDKFFEL